jgi:hypothetical protein
VVGVEDSPDFRGDGRKHGAGLRASRDEGRDTTQGRLHLRELLDLGPSRRIGDRRCAQVRERVHSLDRLLGQGRLTLSASQSHRAPERGRRRGPGDRPPGQLLRRPRNPRPRSRSRSHPARTDSVRRACPRRVPRLPWRLRRRSRQRVPLPRRGSPRGRARPAPLRPVRAPCELRRSRAPSRRAR